MSAINADCWTERIDRAIRWHTRSIETDSTLERFLYDWFAVVTLAEFGVKDRRGVCTKDRMGAYLNEAGLGLGDVLPTLRRAYTARCVLFHKGNDNLITPALVERLTGDVERLIDAECELVRGAE